LSATFANKVAFRDGDVVLDAAVDIHICTGEHRVFAMSGRISSVAEDVKTISTLVDGERSYIRRHREDGLGKIFLLCKHMVYKVVLVVALFAAHQSCISLAASLLLLY
jgi:hypothetical protein